MAIQLILLTAPGMSNEGRSSPLLALAPLFLGPEFQLGARWNRLVEAVKTRKKREKTGEKWARYGLKRVNKEGTGGINWFVLGEGGLRCTMACEDSPTMLHACSGPSDGMLWSKYDNSSVQGCLELARIGENSPESLVKSDLVRRGQPPRRRHARLECLPKPNSASPKRQLDFAEQFADSVEMLA